MNLRKVGFISIVALLAQFLLGIATNLWTTIGAKAPWSHIGNVGLLGAHGILGVLIALMAFVVLGRAFEVGSPMARAFAAMSLLGVLGAIGCGVAFVASSGRPAYSFGMALGWALALFANACLAWGS